jgi:hypothetical protein
MASRPEYITGARLSANDLAREQHYGRQRARMHDRFLHGAGIVCGLQVVPAGVAQKPWAVRVCPGYAVSPCGDEIELRCSTVVDIAEWLWTLRTPAQPRPAEVLIAIRYAQSEERPIVSSPESCHCAPEREEPSRIADGSRIDVLPLSELPAAARPVDLCKIVMAACSGSAPASAYVVLAVVALPTSPTVVIGGVNVTALG